MSKYVVPIEIKSETKISKNVYLIDLIYIMMYFLVSNMFLNIIHPSLKLPYMLYNIIVAILLTRKFSQNQKRKLFQAIYFLFIRDKTIYHAICDEKKELIRHEEEK